MKKLQFKIDIHAPKEKVWETLWSENGYRAWTVAFTEGSYAESDWQEGSEIKFLAPGGNGMFGIIKKKIDNEQMTFEHQGEIKEGKKEEKDWGPSALEDYKLKEVNGVSELVVELDMNEEYLDYFNNVFPKALQLVKELSEK